MEDGAGQWLAVSYDRWGRVAKVADSAGREVVYEYNLEDELVKVTRSGNEVASYTYAPGHLLSSWADPRLPAGSKRGKLAFDEMGRVVEVRDGMDRVKHTLA